MSSKSVLIVEKDVSLMHTMRDALTARGFTVEETTDGKGAPELIRKKKPDSVVLAVDLDAGQNGYIICKKLKSDDELKGVPVVIVGDPKGFAQHQKLKTRAEDYVGKPLDPATLVERVGTLIGFPAAPEQEADSFDPAALLGDEASGAEEIAVEAGTSETFGVGDPDLDMVDSMFEDKPAPAAAASPFPDEEIPLATDLSDEDLGTADKTVVGFMPLTAPPAREEKPAAIPEKARPITGANRAAVPHSSPSSLSHDTSGEARELKSKVAELTSSLDDANGKISELEGRLRDLESALESKTAEADAARSAAASGGKNDKEVFQLKDSVNKKDKEILRLKNEVNEKEREVVELREKENNLDQQVAESSGELAKRDGQIKTLQGKVEQLTAEKKKNDQALTQAKDEARSATARAGTLAGEVEQLQARTSELETDLESTRAARADAETARDTAEAARAELESARHQADTELAEVRGELDSLRSQLDEKTRESDELRSQLDQAHADHESTRTSLQTTSDEAEQLRSRVAEVEAEHGRAQEKANRYQSRARAHQDAIARAREALSQATQALGDPTGGGEDIEIDDLAEA